jgi:hypothetical protein
MDVVDNSLAVFKGKLAELLNGCNKQEYTLLVNICKTTLETLRKFPTDSENNAF